MTNHGHIFSYQLWLETPISIRHRIAQNFGIKKTRPTHVSNDMIIDDGYDLKLLSEGLSLTALETHFGIVGNDYDFHWNNVLLEANNQPIIKDKEPEPLIVDTPIKGTPTEPLIPKKELMEQVDGGIQLNKLQGWYFKKKKLESEGWIVTETLSNGFIMKKNEKENTGSSTKIEGNATSGNGNAEGSIATQN